MEKVNCSKKKKRLLLIIFIGSILVAFVLSPFFPFIVSLPVMGIYSSSEKEDSVMDKYDFDISIPGGMSTYESDWYPFVMCFDASDGFSQYMKRSSLSLTILYNFPAFSPIHGCSRLFDSSSPYYNSFYGAYIVSDSAHNIYGFHDDGSIDVDEVASVPAYDFYYLVLSDFGLAKDKFLFANEISSVEKNVDYMGYNGWTRIDSTVTVSGVSHKYNGFVQSYLQYGRPTYKVYEEFAQATMSGRIYTRYFEELNSTIFMYVIAGNEDIVDDCDTNILSLSHIK